MLTKASLTSLKAQNFGKMCLLLRSANGVWGQGVGRDYFHISIYSVV